MKNSLSWTEEARWTEQKPSIKEQNSAGVLSAYLSFWFPESFTWPRGRVILQFTFYKSKMNTRHYGSEIPTTPFAFNAISLGDFWTRSCRDYSKSCSLIWGTALFFFFLLLFFFLSDPCCYQLFFFFVGEEWANTLYTKSTVPKEKNSLKWGDLGFLESCQNVCQLKVFLKILLAKFDLPDDQAYIFSVGAFDWAQMAQCSLLLRVRLCVDQDWLGQAISSPSRAMLMQSRQLGLVSRFD